MAWSSRNSSNHLLYTRHVDIFQEISRDHVVSGKEGENVTIIGAKLGGQRCRVQDGKLGTIIE